MQLPPDISGATLPDKSGNYKNLRDVERLWIKEYVS